MSSDNFVIRVSNLSKCFQIYPAPRDRLKQFVLPRIQRFVAKSPKQYFREFWALKDISFEVTKGETFGIIGRNGSGKSTLLQIICGIMQPSSGNVEVNGRVSALLELGAGFNPEFTGRENVYNNGSILGLTHDEIDNRFDEIAAFADIGEFIDHPVKLYSSGMYVRLAFAIAINVDPDILVVDEALSVGDARFQARCMSRINKIREKGASILFVSHDTETVRRICNNALVLDQGEIVNHGLAAYMSNWYLAFMTNDFDLEKTRQIENKAAESEQQLLYEQDETAPMPLHRDEKQSQQKIEVDWQIDRAQHPEFTYFRHGDGNAKIVSVGLYDMQDNALKYAILGEKIQCRIELEFLIDLPYHIVGMHIVDGRGTDIIAINSYQERLGIPTVKAGDKLSYVFEIPVELRPGNYGITCTAAYDQQKMEWMDWIDNVLLFRVVDTHPGRTIFGVYYPHSLKVRLESMNGVFQKISQAN